MTRSARDIEAGPSGHNATTALQPMQDTVVGASQSHPKSRTGSPRRVLLVAAAFAGLAIFGVYASFPALRHYSGFSIDPTNPAVTLDDVEREVTLRYGVPDISASSLDKGIVGRSITLFDVRTIEEYEAGHIPGAIRVDPEMTGPQFLALHGDRLKQQPAVLYCAVGVRSSVVLTRLLQEVSPAATAGVYNLRGGTFRWAAEGRPLVAAGRPGQSHPFNDDWGKLLQRTLSPR